MSTADGLVISTSQVFANDIYRRSLAPLLHPHASAAQIDHNVLRISRWGVAVVMAAAAWLAWESIGANIALMVWAGLGGLMAALVGPVILGVFWRGVTASGALWGFAAGALGFIALQNGWLPDGAAAGGLVERALFWLAGQAGNPFACTTIAEVLCLAVTWGCRWSAGRCPPSTSTRSLAILPHGAEPMQHWLFKTEPETYSIADLQREGRCGWEGIRNYQARNRLRDEVAVGDPVLIYHSNCAEPAVVGLGEICGAARPDPFQFDPDAKYYDPKSDPEQPRWVLVDVAYRETFATPLTLRAIKADPCSPIWNW